MFCTGDQVVYGIHGVCSIVAQEKQIVNRKPVIYLVLEPLGQRGSRYLVPTQNAAAMAKLRPMLTREQMEALFASNEIRQNIWIPDENRRKQQYRELIGSGDREKLMQLVYTLYLHKQRQLDAGKKCHMIDDNFLRDAERLLASEVAVVLEIQQDQARQYIREHLSAEAAAAQ